ncbi:MAG TPA: hypothetical protein VIM58_12240, partial [Candidatus Methylacidiphilales bacterium]
MSRFPRTDPRRGRDAGRGDAFALVVVLGLIVLLSFLMISFMTLTRSGRISSFNYSQSLKADEIAQGGLDYVIANLRQELMDTNRSAARKDASGYAVYVPATNAFAVPERMAAGAIPATLTNLVKISSGRVPFYTNGPVLASGSSTSAASANGRSISRTRWNRPLLIEPGVLGNLVFPDWILVTRSGFTNAWNPALKDFSSPQAAIGRIAFSVYDEGGLLDVGTGGYPDSLAGDASVRRKGLLPFADASVIPSFGNPGAFVGWRNAASAASVGAYTNFAYVYGATNGFLKIAPGDRAFLSRQDLIQYVQTHGTVVGTNALPYLTTFTRELNSPSYSPRTPAGSTVNYAAQADVAGATNADLAPLRDASHRPIPRFPLSRLALFANPAGNAADIRKYFGLVRNADGYSWDYNPDSATLPATTSIAALSAVPSGRLPNFFELLQAGILQGSLGATISVSASPPTSSTGLFVPGPMYDQNRVRQILAIGANIIDQYDADGFPTVINVRDPNDPTGTPVAGMENLPQLSEAFVEVYRPTQAEGGDAGRQKILARMHFEVWNPVQNATAPPAAGQGPANFRIVAHDGSMKLFAYSAYDPLTPQVTSTLVDFGSVYGNSSPFQIQFANQAAFSEPTVLDTSNSTNSDPRGVAGTTSGIYLGGFAALPDSRLPGAITTHPYQQIKFQGQATVPSGSAFAGYRYGISLDVQFQDPGGNWRTYQSFPYGLSYSGNAFPSVPDYYRTPQAWQTWDLSLPEFEFARIDPRGFRWGLGSACTVATGGSPSGSPGQSLRPGSAAGAFGG